jgi:predicted metal-dependent hydrolase
MQIPYKVIRSKRKTVALQIHPDGSIIVRAPLKMPVRDIHAFVEEKAEWIAKQLPKEPIMPFTDDEIRQLAKAARLDLPKRVQHFAPLIGVTYGRITIRSQRSRWGSCSSKGNLNFNCLLMLCPEEVRDYVVVHELCHRIEMNHSPRFWAQAERVCPDYKVHRKWLKEHGSELIGKLP